jgi:DNA helicase-2/ATP-dependent DNA helicase PcrA
MFRFFGPPGTGKTTLLLDMVEEALEKGTNPHDIAFLAFTRKAANEAKERASVRFNLNMDSDLFYFRTLHSLSYKLLNIAQKDLMQPKHYGELSTQIGFALNVSRVGEIGEDAPVGVTDHPILSLINLARLKKTVLQKEYNTTSLSYTWDEVAYVSRAYDNYKKVKGLIDYTDMLELFVGNAAQVCPPFKLCFLDEAQDLSPLQWDIAHAIDAKSEKMFVAGDDDQAIYRWAGADPDAFISLECGAEVLEQSYRIPRVVHALATNIAQRIHNRFPKVYRPRNFEGSIKRLSSVQDVDMSEGDWLVMAQANYMLTPVAYDLKSGGYLFERNGARSINGKLSEAVNGWEQLRQGRVIEGAVCQLIYGFMSGNGGRVARGKKKIENATEKKFSLEQLQQEHGLLATGEMIWHDAMDKIPPPERAYITALLRRGEKFNAKPRIRLSTIHGTKGGEAENVVLFLDLTAAALRTSGDDLHRVFYVAVTRTKANLFIIEPEDYTRAYNL